ncbi:MAG TPA: hypothetical protein VGB52_05045 [Actinomycetota bacterium]
MEGVATISRPAGQGRLMNLIDDLNGRYHKIALRVFMALVFAHLAEHIIQAIQIFAFNGARPDSRGILGQWWPWLVKSEGLHYAYAIIMLVGLMLFRPGFTGKSRTWWNIALGIQFWHHIEHVLLLGQAVVGANLFGKAVPTSVVQVVVSRVELHLLYNTLVLIPMVIAMVYHLWPPEKDRAEMTCTCAVKSRRGEPVHAHA